MCAHQRLRQEVGQLIRHARPLHRYALETLVLDNQIGELLEHLHCIAIILAQFNVSKLRHLLEAANDLSYRVTRKRLIVRYVYLSDCAQVHEHLAELVHALIAQIDIAE